MPSGQLSATNLLPNSFRKTNPAVNGYRLPNGVCIFLIEADATTMETVISAVGRLAPETADESQRLEARSEELTC